VCVYATAAAQYLYDRNKPQPVFSFGSPHRGVSDRIDEEVEEADDDYGEESDTEVVGDGHAELHNSSSQTSLIRQKLSAEDNGQLS